MNEEYALGFLAVIVSPVIAVGLWMGKNLMDLKERIARLEAKSDIFHPPPHDLQDK